ncbi:MAG: hypothetical protein LBL51_02265 [Synergistaceae bacterium]|nr:hypothetical protein [Synergistaceae bacterium]
MNNREQALNSLSLQSTLTVLLRTLYHVVADYCVLPPSRYSQNYAVFAKEQLILLLERDSPDALVADIPMMAQRGQFHPLAFSDAVSTLDISEPEDLPVLVVDEGGAELLPLERALRPRAPDFPAWWEAPLLFAMTWRGRLYLNRAAEDAFGSGWEHHLPSLPDKDEFLLAMETGKDGQGQRTRSLMFRRLEDNVFVLDDCTGDAEAAADITWWAAAGKAWTAELDEKKRAWRRIGKEEMEELTVKELKSLRSRNTLIACEWEGERVGFLCIEKAEKTESVPPPEPRIKLVRPKEAKAEPPAPTPAKRTRRVSRKESEAPEDDILKTLGPQAMGLLTPGTGFAAPEAPKGRNPDPQPTPPKKRHA